MIIVFWFVVSLFAATLCNSQKSPWMLLKQEGIFDAMTNQNTMIIINIFEFITKTYN